MTGSAAQEKCVFIIYFWHLGDLAVEMIVHVYPSIS